MSGSVGDFDALRSVVSARFAAGWKTSGVLITPVEWPNGPTFEPTANVTWVRFSILSGAARRISIGQPAVYRHVGQVIVQIFSPLGTGDGNAARLADRAADIFRDVSVPLYGGDLRFQAPSVREVGAAGQLWWQTNATAPFQRDYVRGI